MIGKQLVEETEKEARLLRQYATLDERDNLDLDTFDPLDRQNCIYGQMTGSCFSKRATSLIKKCAAMVVHLEEEEDCSIPIEYAPCRLPRGNKRKLTLTSNRAEQHYFSPIEIYIAQEDADIPQLLAFLQGNSKKLNLHKTINC